jgi:NDP-sugar pyrophosphorylase family protein
MNKSPLSFCEGTPPAVIKRKMLEREIDCIPVLGTNAAVTGIHSWTDLFCQEQPVYEQLKAPVVIMAGGEGRRLGAITRVLPKPLLPIGDTPVLEHIMSRFRRYGCNDFRISLNYRSSIVKAYLKDNNQSDRIAYIEEKNPLGTAGSLHYLKDKLHTSFFLTNCDVIIDANYAEILKFHRANGNKITLVTSMKHHTIPYGICKIQKGGALKSIVEKPEYDLLVNTGMYVLEASVLKDIPRKTFFHMTDLIARYLKSRKKVGVYPISDNSWLDTGQIDELHGTLNRLEHKATLA